METLFQRSFERDLKKIEDYDLLDKIRQIIASVESARNLLEVSSVRKMKGTANYYRIRVGDYRIGLEAHPSRVEFARVLHRKDIYKGISKNPYFDHENRLNLNAVGTGPVG